MGWTEYEATEFTNGGRISVAREIKKEVMHGLADGYEYIDGSLVGSVFYAAIKDMDGDVFCAVYLTGTRDNRWFSYKGMSERWKPYYFGCPDKILDKLTPTDDEWSNEWREECRNRNREKKVFDNLPDGSVAKWTATFSCRSFDKGDEVTLVKGKLNRYRKKSPKVWHVSGEYSYIKPSAVTKFNVVRRANG